MKDRCYRKKTEAFERYGGRGIIVCPQWLNSFEQFLSDMGPRPSLQHSLDRKTNDGNYEPENCRWATDAEQRRNQRRSRIITIMGQTLCAKDWAVQYGINYKTLHMRLKHGWDPLEALTRPIRKLSKRRLKRVCGQNY